MKSRALMLVCLGAFAVGCEPEAVDPDATFTIEGSLVDEDGVAAANTDFRIFKVDSFIWRDDGLLHYDDLSAYPGLSDVFEYETDSDGDFSVNLKGSDVNAADGSNAAQLAVVYQKDGDEFEYLATSTVWNYFTNANPVWAAGTLRLWDAGSASQSSNKLTFDWGDNDAPSGNNPDASRPFFLYAYESGAAQLQWAEHTFDTEIEVPRGAFGNGNSPDWFLCGYSQEAIGSRYYFHRSSLKTSTNEPVTGWQNTDYNNNFLDEVSEALVDSQNHSFVSDDAEDGDLSTSYDFPGDAINNQVFYVDLGEVEVFRDVLIYDLGVAFMDSANVTLSVSDENSITAPVSNWTQLESWQGDYDFENWIYLGYSAGNSTESGRWLKIEVDDVGSNPYFLFVDEVMVKYGN